MFGYLLLLVALASVNAESFEGYKVYQIKPQTQEDAQYLKQLKYRPKYDFWEESRVLGKPSDVMVSPEEQEHFERELSQRNMSYVVVVDDVERLLQTDRVDQLLTRSTATMGPGQVTFTSFMKYEEQMDYVRRLGRDYPDIATVTTAGHSFEGREILMIKISSGQSQTTVQKPTIFIDAGIHCREWIAHPVALYLIQQLVENSDNAALYQNVDWVIIPNLNPDGYIYTYNHNRLWRKNRRLAGNNACYGTDLNRNFEYQWMFDGASQESCTEIYAGPEAFSEPETRVLRDWFLNNQDANVKLYMAVHSFGEMVLYPWGYAPILSEDSATLRHVGELAARAIEAASTMNSQYTVENSATLLGAAAGAADDWAKAVGNVALSYTLELPNGDTRFASKYGVVYSFFFYKSKMFDVKVSNQYGRPVSAFNHVTPDYSISWDFNSTGNGDAPFWFMIPARQILPVVRETFEGFKALHKYIEDEFWTALQPSS